jgi:hypothetical protein
MSTVKPVQCLLSDMIMTGIRNDRVCNDLSTKRLAKKNQLRIERTGIEGCRISCFDLLL